MKVLGTNGSGTMSTDIAGVEWVETGGKHLAKGTAEELR